MLVIQSADGAVFGAFTGAPWKESKDFYGTSDSFLYQLSPVTAVYRPKASGQPNYMYCNSHARSKGYDQQAHGIGFGGTIDQPRLFLAETFDYNDNYAGTQDVTYENGPFLPVTESGTYPKHFDVEALEVWGVGGDEVVQQALGAQSKARSIRDEGIRRAKKVDRAAFLDDLRSGVIDSKAFQHRQQIDGVRINGKMRLRCRIPRECYSCQLVLTLPTSPDSARIKTWKTDTNKSTTMKSRSNSTCFSF